MQSKHDLELEMKRLKLELKQTMDMYSNACKEAITAKQKVNASFIPDKSLRSRIQIVDLEYK